MRNRWTVFFIALWVLAFPFPVAAKMYVVSYEPNWDQPPGENPAHWAALYAVNYLNGGSVTKVGDIECQGNKIVLTDIAFEQTSRIMYGINSDGTGSQLYSIDYQNPTAGVVQAKLLCTFEVMGLEGLVGSPEGDGTVYAGSGTSGTDWRNPGAVYQIDPSKGTIKEVTTMGSLGLNQPIGLGIGDDIAFGGDMEVDDSNILYGSVRSNTSDEEADIFGWAQLNEGGANLISQGFPNAISGLAFVWPDTMYACDYFGAFYEVNRYEGTLTFLGNNGVCQVGMTYVPLGMEKRESLPPILRLLLDIYYRHRNHSPAW